MALQTFFLASPKAKVLNLTFLLFNFMAWICCCVSFGGKLVHGNVKNLGGAHGIDLYYNYILMPDGTKRYFSNSDQCVDGPIFPCNKCDGAGKGLVAMQVFAFLGLTAVLFMTVLRILGSSVSFLEPTRKSLLVEFGITALNAFWFFLSVCIYGGGCFHAVTGVASLSGVTGTGFAYLICCFFFLLINIAVGFVLRSDASTHLGAAGAMTDYQREDGTGSTDYNPSNAGYQYNADASAAYAGQYNGGSDVTPSVPADQNL